MCLQGELVMLRAEVLVLAAQLKDAENRCSAQVLYTTAETRTQHNAGSAWLCVTLS